MNSLLLDDRALVPYFVSDVLPIFRIVLFAIVALCAIIVIITTLFQNEDSNSADVITGQQESYYSKNKGGSRDGKLRLITIICSCIIAVCVILYFVFLLIENSYVG